MADQQRIQEARARLEAFRAGNSSAPVSSTTAPVQAPTPSPAPTDRVQQARDRLTQLRSGAVPYAKPVEVPQEPNKLVEMAKSVFGAPATIAARPFQAAAELAGASSEDVNKFTKNIPLVGGLVAPVPENFGDVKKDVGRGVQTVALGTGAPIAGGAAFGVGSSLEQGNDLFSKDTLANTAIGAGTGFLGKAAAPFVGDVASKVTPNFVKKAGTAVAAPVQKFAEDTKLFGGIAAKPSAALEKGFQSVDDAIAGKTIDKVADSATQYYRDVNKKDFTRPAKTNESQYHKTTAIYDDALEKGIKLEDVLDEKGIAAHKLVGSNGKYNSKKVAEQLDKVVQDRTKTVVRPALKFFDQRTPRIPQSEVQSALLKKIDLIPDSQIDHADRQWMRNQILKKHSGEGASATARSKGYSLENLFDDRIAAGKKGKYKIGQSASDERSAVLARKEEQVFRDTFDKAAPPEFKEMRREFEKDLLLSEYIKSLHGKDLPVGIVGRTARLFGRTASAIAGGGIAGYPGAIIGSNFGDNFFSYFNRIPGPAKGFVLRNLKDTEPAVFKKVQEMLGKKETAQLMLMPGKRETLFSTPGGKTTPNMQEAVDIAAVEAGRAKTGSSMKGKRLKDMVQGAQENMGPYTPPADLPVIRAGKVPKKPRSLNDIY